jgi:hypothetical protein
MPEIRPPEPGNGPPNVPVQDVANYIAEEALSDTKSTEPEGMIGFCTECMNPQPDQYMERNIFYAEGSPVPCKFCGGVTAIVPESLITQQSFKDRLNQMRGIGSTREV